MTEFEAIFQVLTMPLKRVFVFLFSLECGGATLGAFMLIGVFFAILIEIIVHSHNHAIDAYEQYEYNNEERERKFEKAIEDDIKWARRRGDFRRTQQPAYRPPKKGKRN